MLGQSKYYGTLDKKIHDDDHTFGKGSNFEE